MIALAVPPLPSGHQQTGSPDRVLPDLASVSNRSTRADETRPTWTVLFQRLPSTIVRQATTPANPADQRQRSIPADDPDDEDLLAAIGSGDGDALATLYDRYGRTSFVVAYRILDDGGTAEDAVQEAFLAVWRQARSYRPERGAVRSWLLAIVRNAAIDRRRGRHARPLGDVPLADLESRLATEADETFVTVESALLRECIQAALAALPIEQRRAIELAFFHGLSHHEIAARTGLPLGTVKGRLRLGLAKLRAILSSHQPVAAAPGTRPLSGV